MHQYGMVWLEVQYCKVCHTWHAIGVQNMLFCPGPHSVCKAALLCAWGAAAAAAVVAGVVCSVVVGKQCLSAVTCMHSNRLLNGPCHWLSNYTHSSALQCIGQHVFLIHLQLGS